jgi:hypothetical protein
LHVFKKSGQEPATKTKMTWLTGLAAGKYVHTYLEEHLQNKLTNAALRGVIP